MTAPFPPPELLRQLDALAADQAGAVARRQLRELGIPRSYVRTQLRARRWQRPLPTTFVVFTGPLPPLTRVWSAVLYAGPAATASHETAAWLQGLRPDLPERVDVCVLHGHRRRASRAGVRVRQSRHQRTRAQDGAAPPRTKIEDTVLDLTDAARRAGPAIDVVLRACQRRLTTASRLRAAMRQRRRLRWRALLKELLADVVDGVQSELERAYARNVERAHGLPRGRRNAAEGPRGRRRYRDVRYARWRTTVELDGRAAHPDEWRERDDLRDNEHLERQGAQTLRYGWESVWDRPCRTAAQVGRVLRSQGWRGRLRACGPGCAAVSATSDAA